MIKIENFEVMGWDHAIRGMRNPMNSLEKSDSLFIDASGDFYTMARDPFELPWPEYMPNKLRIGPNDHELMLKLAQAGSVHAKYRRMITVYMDITAPLYWWKEFDTYKVGTVANSCSTMYKIAEKEFTLDDFSHEHLLSNWINDNADSFVFEDRKECEKGIWSPIDVLELIIKTLNVNRDAYLKSQNKKFWYQMIQLLPSSYNQKRTVMLNYEVLANIYKSRCNHKLDEWLEFCAQIKGMPYSELIICEEKET